MRKGPSAAVTTLNGMLVISVCQKKPEADGNKFVCVNSHSSFLWWTEFVFILVINSKIMYCKTLSGALTQYGIQPQYLRFT